MEINDINDMKWLRRLARVYRKPIKKGKGLNMNYRLPQGLNPDQWLNGEACYTDSALLFSASACQRRICHANE